MPLGQQMRAHLSAPYTRAHLDSALEELIRLSVSRRVDLKSMHIAYKYNSDILVSMNITRSCKQ